MGKVITIRFWYGCTSHGSKIKDVLCSKGNFYNAQHIVYNGDVQPYASYKGRVLVILNEENVGDLDKVITIAKKYCKRIEILINDEWMEIKDSE